MFYSQIILAKKGPLGKVWQAAHWGDKKLGRPAIFSTDISITVDNIVSPAAPMALRVSGHLLLGVVRIYTRKVKYLLDDCQHALVQVKLAYTTSKENTNIDLNKSSTQLNVSNFGEYVESTIDEPFEIPFDINAETNEEDWVPAELGDESTLQNVEAAAPAIEANIQEEDEDWGVFDPMDGEDEEDNGEANKRDDSTVSDIEKPRAAVNDSMASDPTVRRESAAPDNEMQDDGEIAPFDDNDEMVPMNDDDEDLAMDVPEGGRNSSVRLSDSKDDDGNDPSISFGDDDDTTPGSKKRKSLETSSAKKKKPRRRRKVLTDDGHTELSSDHIRKMLSDQSKIVLPYIHPADQQVKKLRIWDQLSFIELTRRPALADDGNLAPELLELWSDNTAIVAGKAVTFQLRDENESVEQEEEEVPRGAEQNDDDVAFPEADDEEVPFPDYDDGGIPFDDDEEQPVAGPDDLDVPMGTDSPAGHSRSSMESIFSLGATNAMDDNEEQPDADQPSKWHKNTIKVFQVLKSNITPTNETVSYDALSAGVSRRTAAGFFFELLQLKTLGFIDLNQAEPQGDIVISPGVKFFDDDE